MFPHFFLFIIIILMISFPLAYGETIRAFILPDGETDFFAISNSGEKSFANDEIILNNNTLDLSSSIITIPERSETIDEIEIELTKEIKFVSDNDNFVTISNTALLSIIVSIIDQTTISGPDTWNGEITPPTQITTSGTVPSGFQTPITSISIGSPDAILVFDKVVTILLDRTTGQFAYKLAGTNNWNLISTCLGTFANPTPPTNPGECSISNGIDTKILTFHFTEFGPLDPIPPADPPAVKSSSTKSSGGGSGRTGVGPANEIIIFSPTTKIFPVWFQQSLVSWWVNDSITDQEFKNAVGYLLDKRIIDINIPEHPSTQLMDLAPSTKHLFGLWSNEKLSDSSIIGMIHYYRNMGVW